MAADEIERFRREIVERTGERRDASDITDQELLREVMNTVGREGQLGGAIRCVVSVSMLTEGWDANTVTHVLGVRAFGTQLLCEQVIGRALRRQSYDLNEDGPNAGLFNVEYADVLGIPFDFTAKPVVAPPQPPRETVVVRAVRPDRDALEIRFPRVEGYRVELPEERLTAAFNDESVLVLTPDLVGPTITRNQGIIGEAVDLNLQHLGDTRASSLLYHLTQRLLYTKWRDPGQEPPLFLFGQLKRITKQWLDTCLVCKGDTYPALLMYQTLADMACERITAGITRAFAGERPIKAMLDAYNPEGSTRARALHHVARGPLADGARPLARELGDPRQRLGGRVLPRGRGAPAGPGVREEPQPRPRSPVPLRLRDAPLPAGLHRARRRRPRARGSPQPRGRDQGLPARGREGEEGDDGHLLGAGRQPPRRVRAVGVRRVHRRVRDRERVRGEGRAGVRADDRDSDDGNIGGLTASV